MKHSLLLIFMLAFTLLSSGHTLTPTEGSSEEILCTQPSTIDSGSAPEKLISPKGNYSQPSVSMEHSAGLPMYVSIQITAGVSCPGGSDGQLRAVLSGGNATFIYAWSNGTVNNNVGFWFNSIGGLAAGTYTVTVTDGIGLTTTASITLNDPEPTSAIFQYGASVFLQTSTDPTPVITGTPGGSFTCPSSDLVIDANTGTIDVSASAPATYTITYTAPGSCLLTTSNVSITINGDPIVDAGQNQSICSSQTSHQLNATVVNATSIEWTSTGTGTFLDPSIEDATYIPSQQDVSVGSIVLTLTANPTLPVSQQASDAITLTIYNPFTAGAILTSSETLCYNGDPAEIGNLSAASGGDEMISYQWQQSITGASSGFTDIANANAITYNPPSGLTVTTWYRRMAKDGTCNTTFTGSLGVWKVLVYDEFTAGAILSSGETICYGDDPIEIGNLTNATGGDEMISYQWQKSITGASSGFTDIANANAITYNPPSGLTVTTWYRRMAKDGTCNTTFTSSLGVWKVLVYDEFTAGATLTSGETICYGDDPIEIGNLTNTSGGDEMISYQWQQSITGASSGFTDIANANAITYNPPSGLTVTTWYRRMAKDGTCNTTFTSSLGVWKVLVYDEFTAGAILSSGETICYGVDPIEIGNLSAASGGDEMISYQWQQSITGASSAFTDIANANAITYNPPSGLTVTTWYRRMAKDGTCNTTFTGSLGVWKVLVYDEFTAGAILSSGETICYGDDPIEIGNLSAASGGDEMISYQWQKSITDASSAFTDIVGADSESYTPPSGLTESSWYRRWAKDASCNTGLSLSSGVWEVLVNHLPVIEIMGDTNICIGNSLELSTAPHIVYCDTDCDQPQNYCGSSANLTNLMHISNFSLLGVNNASGLSQYSNHTATIPSIELSKDSSYIVDLTTYSYYGFQGSVTVYVDWDRDGAFEYSVLGMLSNQDANQNNYSIPITVPTNAVLGDTRLRVILCNDSGHAACGVYPYGETEDYLIKVKSYDPSQFVSYNWMSNSSSVSNDETFEIAATSSADNGIYQVQVVNIFGCSDVSEVEVVINDPLPVLLFDTVSTMILDTFMIDAGEFDTYSWNTGSTSNPFEIPSYGMFSVEVSLNGCAAKDSIIVLERQDIYLRIGWSMFSTYLEVSSNLSELMASIVSDVVIVKSELGGVYWPQFGINNIGNIQVGEAFVTKMSQQNLLVIHGNAVDPEFYPLELAVGNNLIGYLRRTAAPIEDVISDIESSTVLVLDDNGFTYWPIFNINTIGLMEPGEGYRINMNANATLIYPSNEQVFSKSDITRDLPNQYRTSLNTGSNMVLLIPEVAWQTLPEKGDEVGAFNSNGQLTGAGVFDGKQVVLTIWGDNEIEKNKGMKISDEVELRLWSSSNGHVEVLTIMEWFEGNGTYENNTVAIAGKICIKELELDIDLTVYPNPVKTAANVKFSIPLEGNAKIEVFNSIGKQVRLLTDADYAVGTYNLQFYTVDLSADTYIIRLRSNGQVVNKMIQIVK